MALSILYWSRYVDGHVKLTRKSEAAVESGRVLRFSIDELRVIQANVQASMRDTSYSVQIFLEQENNGAVQSTRCQCPMAEYKCHHVATVLLFGYKRASKTDIKCSWLKHPKSAPPKTTVTMTDLYPPRQQEYRALKRTVTADDRSFLYNCLGQLGRFTALHWILLEEPKPPQLPLPLIEDVLLSPGYLSSQDPRTYFRRSLVLSQEKITQIAFMTTGQRENSLWAAARKLQFTASNFGQIIAASKRNRLCASLKKRLLSAYNLQKRAPIQWGITQEKNGLDAYCRTGGVTLVQTGIWLHESGILVASPDGFVQGDYCGRVHLQDKEQPVMSPDIIEVKCPFSAKDMTITEACHSNKDFYLDLSPDGRMCLKRSHDYWHQIQGQLHITGTQCCDLVVWTTKDMQIVRILKDNSWAINMSSMIDFYMLTFLPSLK
ncbi:uncharacterized protein LOC128206399 [Mya arenaria]|uniref:uncharacterized protein LOC128206399 n=1 Tax=Mya arenaria TaxID=6604 RepID=UPI0022E0CBF2|nr:uncharacterized protein LOC128206399 [Mya arenaria]